MKNLTVSVQVVGDDGIEPTLMKLRPGDGFYNLFRKPGVRKFTTRRLGIPVALTLVEDPS